MSDNDNSTGAKLLPAFSNIKPFEQLAVQLRAEGKEYEVIANTINSEFDLAYKQSSLRGWFMAGGRLEQAYNEYNEWHADQSIIAAKIKIKKMSQKAADTISELMGNEFDGTVRHNAAKTTLAKYIPDRQVVVDETKADEIPSAIADAGDQALDEDENGQSKVADTPPSEDPSQ